MSRKEMNSLSNDRLSHNADGARFESYLREAREVNGISQEALAREANVSRETIRNIERGLTIPNVLLAITIGTILGWAVTELFKPKKGEQPDGGDN